ncbi:MAG: phospho-N-acetylmuramoyl-pentapeptide-transferase, partial [Bryobacteraceae bacterium]
MFYWLFYQIVFQGYATEYPVLTPFRLFGFVTFRTALSSLTALFLCVIVGPWLIRRLREFQIGQHIREEGPKSHQAKAGTPTMGGVLIIISIVVPTLFWSDLRNPYVWIALFALLSFGAIGFYDDYTKVRKMQNLGLTAKRKFALQVFNSIIIGMILLFLRSRNLYDTEINVPFFKQFRPDLLIEPLLENPLTFPIAFIFFFGFLVLVIAGASNAVNLTDGLDGLAIGLMIIAASAITMLAYVSGHAQFAAYLEILRLPDSAELTIFCASMT